MLAQDERSHDASVKVRADNGVVNVTYLPQDARLAQVIPEVCRDLPGARDVRVTMAMTNLLWIQEEFQPHSELYDEVVELATKWNAAVELIRPAPEEEGPAPQEEGARADGKGGCEAPSPGNTTAGSRKTLPRTRLPTGASSIRSTSLPGSAGRVEDGSSTVTRTNWSTRSTEPFPTPWWCSAICSCPRDTPPGSGRPGISEAS